MTARLWNVNGLPAMGAGTARLLTLLKQKIAVGFIMSPKERYGERFQIGAIQQWRLQKLMGIARHKVTETIPFLAN